jgi:hypothetical protein
LNAEEFVKDSYSGNKERNYMDFQRHPWMKQLFWRTGVVVMAVLLIGLVVAGCGNKSDVSTTTGKTTITNTSTTKTAVSSTASTTKSTTTTTTATAKTTSTTTSRTVSTDPFTRLEEGMDEQGILYAKNWMSAESIGAKEGYKYETNKGTFELYLYDQGTDAYKAAVKNKGFSVGDTVFPAIIKDGLALYFYPNAKDELKTKVQGLLFP